MVFPQGMMTFRATSETDSSNSYAVDLLMHHGNGQCDCPNFRCKLAPFLITDGIKERLICKHIKACRDYMKLFLGGVSDEFLDEVIQGILKTRQPETET